MHSRHVLSLLLTPLFGVLAACGGSSNTDSPGTPIGAGPTTWQQGSFLPSTAFANRCAAPRPGSDDFQGTTLTENNWLRSWTNETYLWYSEVTDRDPALYSTPDYFDLLRTNATTDSGQPKDKFHFTYDTEVWNQLSQGGISAGYGAQFAILSPTPPRRIVVAYTEPGSPAEGVLFRGDEVVLVDGEDAVDGNTQAVVDALNAGLFPDAVGEDHTFVVRDTGGTEREVELTSAVITLSPVPIVDIIPTGSGDVGYIQFNDHIAPAEDDLEAAIAGFVAADVSDLILDLRYNGGGYLDLASELAYMIANTTRTAGQTFERIVFNDKHPNINPVTGQVLTPTPFHTLSQGFVGGHGHPLPSLNLDRVYVIAGPDTCSASESIINALRGVGVEVYLIGSTTCGKPYGFYPTDNCGTTYFSIQFRGENAANFGDYTDGFSPENTPGTAGTLVPGCSVEDDFEHQLGDPAESRIAAALAFRASNHQTCPAATGFAPPRLSKAWPGQQQSGLVVSKPAARQNRILRRMRG